MLKAGPGCPSTARCPTRCVASLLPPRFTGPLAKCLATQAAPPRFPLRSLLLLSFPFSFFLKANLSDCYNVTVFLAPSVVSPSALRCCCLVLSRLRREILENGANLEYWQRFLFLFFLSKAKNKRPEIRKNHRVTQVGIKFAFSPGPCDARGQPQPCFLEGPSAAAAFWDPPALLRSSPMSPGGTAPRHSRGTGSPGRAAPSRHISGPRLSVSPQKPPLAAKLLAELPDEARVVAGRFPFPSWTPSSTLGQGLEQAWAYDMKEVRRAARCGGTPGLEAAPQASPTGGLSPGEQ